MAEKREINSCSSLIFLPFFLVGFLHLFDDQLAGLVPEIIVSGIQLNLAIVNIRSMCADFIKEITVMGYHDDRIVEVDQEFLEPFDRIKIKMVCRLVEEQDVRVSKQCLCQKNLDLLAAGQVCHLCVVQLQCFNAKAVQEVPASVSASQPFISANSPSSFARFDTVLIGEVFFCVHGAFSFHDLIETGISHDNGVEYRIAVVFEVILLEEGKTLVPGVMVTSPLVVSKAPDNIFKNVDFPALL